MTELEKMERARMYMEKLANGISPLDDSMIPDHDIVNNVRLSRCFFYTADVLRQVIENGGITPINKGSKSSKKPFSFSSESRERFVLSNSPIPISEIARRFNAAVSDDEMKSLSYRDIKDWLIDIKMLCITADSSGKERMKPTPEGIQMGISEETRTGYNGTYQVVVYSEDAQKFILDNIDSILQLLQANTENEGSLWSAEHDDCLRYLLGNSTPINEIAVALKRRPASIRKRIKKLGVAEE